MIGLGHYLTVAAILLDPVIARESDPYALAGRMLERAGG